MFQIKCPICHNITTFNNVEHKPAECSFCFAAFDSNVVVENIAIISGTRPIGLKLICQSITGIIEIAAEYTVLGRAHTGAALFSAITFNGKPVISRKHCSISFREGKFFLKDEGSSNGTFYGVSKIDCSKYECEIEHNSLIFLGKEAFLAQLILPETAEIQKETDGKKKYRCNQGCGFESEIYYDICPKCLTSNSLVEVIQ